MQIWGLNGPNGPAHGPPRKPMGRPNWAGYSNFGPWAGPCTGLIVPTELLRLHTLAHERKIYDIAVKMCYEEDM
jgi:hypothetical protein